MRFGVFPAKALVRSLTTRQGTSLLASHVATGAGQSGSAQASSISAQRARLAFLQEKNMGFEGAAMVSEQQWTAAGKRWFSVRTSQQLSLPHGKRKCPEIDMPIPVFRYRHRNLLFRPDFLGLRRSGLLSLPCAPCSGGRCPQEGHWQAVISRDPCGHGPRLLLPAGLALGLGMALPRFLFLCPLQRLRVPLTSVPYGRFQEAGQPW